MPEKLYGREAEIENLFAAFDRVVTLMSFVKHRGHDWGVLHARQREVD